MKSLVSSVGRFQRSFASIRTQLILGNVIALSLLLIALGVVCRFVTISFMMRSVDEDLERRVSMFF